MKTSKKKKLSAQALVSDRSPEPSKTTTQRLQNLSNCRKSVLGFSDISWYGQALELPEIVPSSSPPSLEFIREKQAEADLIYQSYVSKHNFHPERPGGSWLDHVIKSGTVVDRLAAHSIKIQNAPLYSIRELKSLVRISASDMQRNISSTLEALKDLFVNILLPPSRKLVYFHKRPLNGENVSEKHLVYWFFEHNLKSIFLQYINVMEEVSKKSIFFVKRKILYYLHDLLIEIPEQEHLILSRLLNRYTDKSKKLASSNTYLFMRLLDRHPKVGILVVKEVEVLLHRLDLSGRAQRHFIQLLIQIGSKLKTHQIIEKLLHIYFYVFRKRVELSRDYHSRTLNVLLTGIDRAIPFSQLESDFFSRHLDVLFKIVHVSEFGRSTRTLTLLFNLMKARGNVTDRFYRALYRKLYCPEMSRSSKKHHFFDLTYRAMAHDRDIARVKAFVKRCAQVCLLQTPDCVCAFLLLLSNMIVKVPELTDMLRNRPEVKIDKCVLSQIVGQIERMTDSISSFKMPRETKSMILYEGKRKEAEKTKQKASKTEHVITLPERDQFSGDSHKPFPIVDASTVQIESYNPNCRDPCYAHADHSSLWELNTISWHYHPQVCKWAKMLLKGKQIDYSNDVFSEFSVYSFIKQLSTRRLDEFLPVSTDTTEKHSETDKYLTESSKWVHQVSQNLLASSDEEDTGVDTFFYKYFVQHKKLTEQKLKYQKTRKGEFKEESAVDKHSSGRSKWLAPENEKSESSSEDEEINLDEDEDGKEAESDYEDFEISDDSESSGDNSSNILDFDSPVVKNNLHQGSKKDEPQSKNIQIRPTSFSSISSLNSRFKRPASTQNSRKVEYSLDYKKDSAKPTCHKRQRPLQG